MNLTEYDLVKIRPSKRQLTHQQTEFYAFFHFSLNTYTDREWGDGTDSPRLFHPSNLDVEQWVRSIKRAGMKGTILTCKHHDGFCLWPSRFTAYSVANSPYRDGRGDIVREVSDACKKEGLKFGIYLSPWDRNHESYGQGKPYDDYFVSQLEELLTGYGDIFAVWFDGACGEGRNGKKQVYDWERYYRIIRKLQPNACISVCGPDVRWCGNEAGDVRPAEWSVVPQRLSMAERIQALSQQADDTKFRERKLQSSDLDLGSRKVLDGESSLIWYPAEVNTSIRPGWFYHGNEDDQVKSLDKLLEIYYGSVGGNATFLLNIPPTPEGRFHPVDVARLQELGDFLNQRFSDNLAEQADFRADSDDGIHKIENAHVDTDRSFYKTRDGVTKAEIEILFQQTEKVTFIVLKEHIHLSRPIVK